MRVRACVHACGHACTKRLHISASHMSVLACFTKRYLRCDFVALCFSHSRRTSLPSTLPQSKPLFPWYHLQVVWSPLLLQPVKRCSRTLRRWIGKAAVRFRYSGGFDCLAYAHTQGWGNQSGERNMRRTCCLEVMCHSSTNDHLLDNRSLF